MTEAVQQGLEATVNLALTPDLRGLRQLNWPGPGNAPIDQGFTGAPVEDDEGYIVGMVVTRRLPASNDPHSPPLSFMNPITNIAELFRGYGAQIILDVSLGVYKDFPTAKRLVDWANIQLERPGHSASLRRRFFPLELLVDNSSSPQAQSFAHVERLHTELDSSDGLADG